MKAIRLNKFLAARGVASRRKADEMVLQGRISLNGSLVTEPGTLVDGSRDRIEVDGQEVRGPEAVYHYVVHKPAGCVTTVHDPEGRPTVLELIPDRKARLYPVGRLDYDTSGLLFIMNDGKLAFRLTHPRYEVPKTYQAVLDMTPDEAGLDRLRQGIQLDDGPTRPAEVRLLRPAGRTVEVTIHEGRNRQVRRMFEAVGRQVVSLSRVRFGPVVLGGLNPGEWREMTRSEVMNLRKLVGLNS